MPRGSLKLLASISLILLLVMGVFVSVSGAGEATLLVYSDGFDDYEAKEYAGSDGPGLWYQQLELPGYTVIGKYEVVPGDEGKFYRLAWSSGSTFLFAFLYYYLPFPFVGPMYLGPNDYIFSAKIKLEGSNVIGGLLFRASPVKVGDKFLWTNHYMAVVNKYTRTIYVQASRYTGASMATYIVAEEDVPEDVDLDDWFSISVTVNGESVKVELEGKTLITYDIMDLPEYYRFSSGTVGLCAVFNSVDFDSIIWSALIPEATTITFKTTQTSTVTVTTTLQGTGTTTITKTTTKTVTAAGSTATTTVTKTSMVPGKTMTVYSAVTRTLTSSATKTVTTVSRQIATKTVTQTVERTVTETQAGWSRCLIATAAFGSEMAPQVQMLREFRDGFVMRTFAGENFMKAFNTFYYSWSPYVAKAEYENPVLRDFIRITIYPLIYSLEVSHIIAKPFSTIPEFAVLISGIIASLLIGLIYVSPILLTIILASRWKKRSLPNIRKYYIILALAFGLLLFSIAEVSSITIVMMLGSAIIVLACIALGAILPTIAIRYLTDRKN